MKTLINLSLSLLVTALVIGCSTGRTTIREETIRDTTYIVKPDTHIVPIPGRIDTLVLRDTVEVFVDSSHGDPIEVTREKWTAEDEHYIVDVFPVERKVHVTAKADSVVFVDQDTTQVASTTTSTRIEESGPSFWDIILYLGAGAGIAVVLLVIMKITRGGLI